MSLFAVVALIVSFVRIGNGSDAPAFDSTSENLCRSIFLSFLSWSLLWAQYYFPSVIRRR